ncbi:glycosyltransferase family 2 protein [Bordetella tumulicola]|uniref:glycosyltransferase family 2 protein n=1 Tax=Bordetella tumulicola TaxID=1649133 RepID=UPI0039EFD2CC
MKLSIAAIVKNEADSLLEWIAFHRVIGVQSFFIADNDSSDGTSEILEALAEHGIVHRMRFPTPEAGNAQMPAYAALLAYACGKCDVLAFIDADEYLLPMDGSTSLLPLIDQLFVSPDVSAVGLNWANFGSGGALFAEDGLVIERFTKRAKQSFGVNFHIKTMLRPERGVKFANPHFVYLSEGRYVDATGADITPHPKHGKGLSSEIVWSGARINHYATKSLEEFFVGKSRRGSATKKARVKHKKYFLSHDRNEEECFIAKQLSQAVLAEHEKLRELIEATLSQPEKKSTATSRWYALTQRFRQKNTV